MLWKYLVLGALFLVPGCVSQNISDFYNLDRKEMKTPVKNALYCIMSYMRFNDLLGRKCNVELLSKELLNIVQPASYASLHETMKFQMALLRSEETKKRIMLAVDQSIFCLQSRSVGEFYPKNEQGKPINCNRHMNNLELNLQSQFNTFKNLMGIYKLQLHGVRKLMEDLGISSDTNSLPNDKLAHI
ncbi:hypothetical protein Ciccas_012129 [Cichlidogyrus casuarinus]|uniref:Uncharacterized protein n=1 Tax=Cichlidogyrus casuarinus TaxID=1844966 RepID=A0ABD2PQ11_9PLAT